MLLNKIRFWNRSKKNKTKHEQPEQSIVEISEDRATDKPKLQVDLAQARRRAGCLDTQHQANMV